MKTNKIIIGFAQSDKNYGLSERKKFKGVVQKLYRKGIRYIDTAPVYNNSEYYVKKIENINQFKIYSKLPPLTNNIKYLAKDVTKKVNNILISNNIKRLHGIFLHDPLLPLQSERWKIIYGSLLKLKKKKIIKNIGLSAYNVDEVKNCLKIFNPDVIQFPLNVFNQEFVQDNFLESLKKKKIKLIARSIFLQGLLCNNSKNLNSFHNLWLKKIRKWEKFCKEIKTTPQEVCIQFIKSFSIIDQIIFGVDDILQLENNLKFLNNKSKLNKNDFKKFYEPGDLINDPRFWKNKEINNNKDWLNSKKYILNGGMLLSKKPSQFLPGLWPTFYKKAKGCEITDKYNKKYLDFCLMGVGTNILGYSNKNFNSKIKKVIDDSNVSTLNSEYSIKLSKKLISLHDWASKSFFARTGAEANAIALRISRAYTQKDEVAICGYHGWHDWYLSSNIINKKNLDQILLPGLSIIGIPKKLKGISHPFKYNDIQSLIKIIKKNKNIGTIFMEVERNEKPNKNFLAKVREIASKNNIVLIFDECTSGFRETFGGLHKKYKVYPDLAVFGKSLGNGIPITAIIGKKEIMDQSLKSFISSTFWSESLGPAAGLFTLDIMEKKKSWLKITSIGKKIKKFWKKLSLKYKLKIEISGLDSMPMFKFNSQNHNYYKTYITQEMMKKKILATNVVYCCIDHDKFLNKYFHEFEHVFYNLSKIDKEGTISTYLTSPVSQAGFGRLN